MRPRKTNFLLAPPTLVATLLLAVATRAPAAETSLIVQSTTSTANSGLYDHLLPRFQAETGIKVNVVAVGTGQAIRNAQNCDGDLLLVHAKSEEEAFVAEGYGAARTDLMYNDFIIVGPKDDPAGIATMSDAETALVRISDIKALFVSRGDDSGTHKKEIALWAAAGHDPSDASGTWYRETGSGMGATLNIAVGMGAYVMTDRASWISFQNRQDFVIHVQGDADLFNQYGVVPVSPEACPTTRYEAATTFANWLLSPEGQEAIAAFKVADQQLFFPNAPN